MQPQLITPGCIFYFGAMSESLRRRRSLSLRRGPRPRTSRTTTLLLVITSSRGERGTCISAFYCFVSSGCCACSKNSFCSFRLVSSALITFTVSAIPSTQFFIVYSPSSFVPNDPSPE